MAVTIREASAADVPAIARLYATEVREFVNTYEYDIPTESEMLERFTGIVEHGFPYLCAELDGEFAGYAYASAFRARAGYRWTVENSVYVAAPAQGRGIGTTLLDALIERCARLGFRQMIAVIGEAANSASIRLHQRAGFQLIGTFPGIGRKHGRWLDTVFMQRALGPGTSTPPNHD